MGQAKTVLLVGLDRSFYCPRRRIEAHLGSFAHVVRVTGEKVKYEGFKSK